MLQEILKASFKVILPLGEQAPEKSLGRVVLVWGRVSWAGPSASVSSS